MQIELGVHGTGRRAFRDAGLLHHQLAPVGERNMQRGEGAQEHTPRTFTVIARRLRLRTPHAFFPAPLIP